MKCDNCKNTATEMLTVQTISLDKKPYHENGRRHIPTMRHERKSAPPVPICASCSDKLFDQANSI